MQEDEKQKENDNMIQIDDFTKIDLRRDFRVYKGGG